MIKAGEYRCDLKTNSFYIGSHLYSISLQDNTNGKPNKVLYVDRGIGTHDRVSSLFHIGLGAYSGDADKSFFSRDDAEGFNFKLRYFTKFDIHQCKETWIIIYDIRPIGKRKKQNYHYFNG